MYKVGCQFVFACQVHVMSTYEYSIICVKTNPTRLLNELGFLKPNTTYLLNKSVISTRLPSFIKAKKRKEKVLT